MVLFFRASFPHVILINQSNGVSRNILTLHFGEYTCLSGPCLLAHPPGTLPLWSCIMNSDHALYPLPGHRTTFIISPPSSIRQRWGNFFEQCKLRFFLALSLMPTRRIVPLYARTCNGGPVDGHRYRRKHTFLQYVRWLSICPFTGTKLRAGESFVYLLNPL